MSKLEGQYAPTPMQSIMGVPLRSEQRTGEILPRVLSRVDMLVVFITIVLFIPNVSVAQATGVGSATWSHRYRTTQSLYAGRWLDLCVDAQGTRASLGLLCRFLRLVSRHSGNVGRLRYCAVTRAGHWHTAFWRRHRLVRGALGTGHLRSGHLDHHGLDRHTAAASDHAHS